MGLSKDDILQLLQPYDVECHEHDAVMTCETQVATAQDHLLHSSFHKSDPGICKRLQAEALSSVPGQVTKNLFLRVSGQEMVPDYSSVVWREIPNQ
jgi:hypothetical protein